MDVVFLPFPTLLLAYFSSWWLVIYWHLRLQTFVSDFSIAPLFWKRLSCYLANFSRNHLSKAICSNKCALQSMQIVKSKTVLVFAEHSLLKQGFIRLGSKRPTGLFIASLDHKRRDRFHNDWLAIHNFGGPFVLILNGTHHTVYFRPVEWVGCLMVSTLIKHRRPN